MTKPKAVPTGTTAIQPPSTTMSTTTSTVNGMSSRATAKLPVRNSRMAAKSRSRDTCDAVPARSTRAVGSDISCVKTELGTSRSSRSAMRSSARWRVARKATSSRMAASDPGDEHGQRARAVAGNHGVEHRHGEDRHGQSQHRHQPAEAEQSRQIAAKALCDSAEPVLTGRAGTRIDHHQGAAQRFGSAGRAPRPCRRPAPEPVRPRRDKRRPRPRPASAGWPAGGGDPESPGAAAPSGSGSPGRRACCADP